MQGTPSSHIENLGLHGPHYAQKIADRVEDSRQPDGLVQVGEQRLSLAPMTPQEMDAALTRACAASQAWYSHFQHTKDLACLDVAYHFMGIAKQLAHLRSAK